MKALLTPEFQIWVVTGDSCFIKSCFIFARNSVCSAVSLEQGLTYLVMCLYCA